MQEVVIFLEDFSWTNSQTLFDNLRKPKSGGMGMKASAMDMSKPDLNDVDYDAYLANDRTLADPEVIDVERNGEVRLRIINAGASTNFTIDLGAVEGTLVAVDGNPIVPLKARQFPLASPSAPTSCCGCPPTGAPFRCSPVARVRPCRRSCFAHPARPWRRFRAKAPRRRPWSGWSRSASPR